MYKQHEKMKDSGIQWLGEIPSHWDTIKTKNIFKEVSRKGYDRDKDLLSATKYGTGIIPKDMLKNNVQIPLGDVSSFKLVIPGDFVISLDSYKVGVGYSEYEGLISPVYTVIEVEQEDIYNKYLNYLLKNVRFISVLDSIAQGIRQGRSIRYSDFKQLEVPIPTLSEQQKIANYLDQKTEAIDKLIEKKERLIELLKEKRQVLINEAVTKGLNPNVKMKDSGIEWIGEIPENWKYGKIYQYCSVKSGGTPSRDKYEYWNNGTINWMSSGEINQKLVTHTKEKITKLGMQNSNASLFPVNTVMIALNGQGKTKATPAILKIETTCNQSLAGMICDKEKVHYEYLFYFLESKYKDLRGLVGESAREGISVSLLKSLYIPIPPLEEQFQIAKLLNQNFSKTNTLIEKIEKQIEQLKEYRQTLIFNAVTGKIDVR